jgi:hypothetical protein
MCHILFQQIVCNCCGKPGRTQESYILEHNPTCLSPWEEKRGKDLTDEGTCKHCVSLGEGSLSKVGEVLRSQNLPHERDVEFDVVQKR